MDDTEKKPSDSPVMEPKGPLAPAPSAEQEATLDSTRSKDRRASLLALACAGLLMLGVASALPVLDAAKVSNFAGPILLLGLAGQRLATLRRAKWMLPAGLAALALCGALGLWLFLNGFAHWAQLDESTRNAAMGESLRRAAWGAGASLFQFAHAITPRIVALICAALAVSCVMALAFGIPIKP